MFRRRYALTLSTLGFVSMVCLTTLAPAQELTYLRTTEPLTLLSANDGAVFNFVNPDLDLEVADSITLVRLGRNHPPIVKTVYGTVPNTIAGPPHMAIAGDGRYGFITNHAADLFASGASESNTAAAKQRVISEVNRLSIIDLESEDLSVVETVSLPPYPVMAVAHPDGKRVLVGGGNFLHVVTVTNKNTFEVTSHKTPIFVTGIAVAPNGRSILATGTDSPQKDDNPFVDWKICAHIFEWGVKGIKYVGAVGDGKFKDPFDGAFSPRFGPFGKRAYVLNGLGISPRGRLDDLLIIDMTTPKPSVSSVVRQLGDGLESLAVHPSGNVAVVSCLDGGRLAKTSHLAVIDLRTYPPELFHHLPVEPVPEGIEFLPDGKLLFVGCTGVHHIAVFDVIDNTTLKRTPYVIRTGHFHASLAIFSPHNDLDD